MTNSIKTMPLIVLCVTLMWMEITTGNRTDTTQPIRVGILAVDVKTSNTSLSIQCNRQFWETPIHIQMEILPYQPQSILAVRQIDDRLSSLDQEGVDVVVAHLPLLLWNHRQYWLNTEKWWRGSDNISDMMWLFKVTQTKAVANQTNLIIDECSRENPAMEYLADVINSIGWKQIAILYDSDYVKCVSQLTDMLSQRDIRVYQYYWENSQSLSTFLDTSYHMRDTPGGLRQYVVLAGTTSITQLFEELNVFDSDGLSPTAMRILSLWLIWAPDVTSHFLENKVSRISNVVLLQRTACYRPPDKSQLMSRIQNVCKACENSTCGVVRDRVEHIFNIKTKLMESQVAENFMASQFRLSTALWTHVGRRFEEVTWNVESNRLTLRRLFPNTAYGLNNMFIQVSTEKWPMFVNTSDNETVYSGMCIDLLEELSRKLNFSYSLHQPADHEWGRKVEGRWTGLMGEIVYHRADLVVAPLSAQEERAVDVDFSTAFFTDYNEIIMRMPDLEADRWLILLRPLNWRVLVSVFGVFPIVTLCVWFCEKLSPYYSKFQNRNQYRGLHHFNETFWYMFGALFTRCGIYLPRAMSSRCVVAFWWLFIVVFVATYCGNLMALLAVTREKKPFNTISEMVSQTEYIWGASNGTYLIELIQTSKDKEYIQMWKGMKKFAEAKPWIFEPELEPQLSKVRAGQYAFITDSTAVRMTLPGNCDMVKADERFLMLQYSLVLPKNSAYTDMFSKKVIAFTESGLLDMWSKKWSPRSVPCPAYIQTGARQIMLIDIQSSFYILFGGILLSALVCLGEIFHGECHQVSPKSPYQADYLNNGTQP